MKEPKEDKKRRQREPETFTGVQERVSKTRIHEGKPDTCFYIFYRKDGQLRGEKVGWISEGYSLKLAAIVRADRIRAIRHDEELPREKPKAPLFKDAVQKYLHWAETNKTRGGREEKSRYENYLKARFEKKRLDEIAPLDLERMKSELLKQGLAPGTVKHALITVREIINKAISWGLWAGVNPITKVKMPVLQNGRERFLSYQEADALLKALAEKSRTMHDSALISLHCGLRAGEIWNLKRQDIDFMNGIITISDPKNKLARKAFMTNAVREMLKGRIPEAPGDYVFKDKRHKGKIDWVSPSFGKVVEALGLNNGITDPRQRVSFHSLRHTFASWLALSGESLLTIRELLGHKTLDMVKRYSHLQPDAKRQATMRLEEAFNLNLKHEEKQNEGTA